MVHATFAINSGIYILIKAASIFDINILEKKVIFELYDSFKIHLVHLMGQRCRLDCMLGYP
jgi:hypothetical protein